MLKVFISTLCMYLFAGSPYGLAQNTYSVNTLFPDALANFYSSSSISEERTIPFYLLGGLIMIDAQIDGEMSNYIFDTGAPSLVINKKNELIRSSRKAFGITGEMKMNTCVVDELQVGGVRKKNVDAMELDISHLERVKKQQIGGIVGVDAYRQEHVMIDYLTQQISFLPRKFRKESPYFEMINFIPFICNEQLPIIQVKINGRRYYFGVDTGAEVNIFNKRRLKRLVRNSPKAMRVSESKILAGVNSSESKGSVVIVEELKIKKQSFGSMEFVIMDLGRFEETMDTPLDGILGYPFLKENLISFDFRKSRLRFWDLK
jgi:predicted aspartyl protease